MNNSEPKVSIIIPIYNTAKYLERCICSIINQTYKNIEIICINDGSTDNSYDIINNFTQKDSRIKIINQENKGLSAARNNGLKIASGEFISFLDSDDYMQPDLISKSICYFKDKDIDFVNFAIDFCGDISEKKQKIANDKSNIKKEGKIYINEDVIMETPVYVWNKIFRKSMIDKYNLNFVNGLNYEDACFTYSYLSVSCAGYYIKDFLYNYIQRKNSIMETSNNSKKGVDHIFIIYEYFKFLDRNKLFLKYQHLYMEIFIHYMKLAIKYSPVFIFQILTSSQNIVNEIVKKYPNEFENTNFDLILNNNFFAIKDLKLIKVIFKMYIKQAYNIKRKRTINA